jgi:hypothetical protein
LSPGEMTVVSPPVWPLVAMSTKWVAAEADGESGAGALDGVVALPNRLPPTALAPATRGIAAISPTVAMATAANGARRLTATGRLRAGDSCVEMASTRISFLRWARAGHGADIRVVLLRLTWGVAHEDAAQSEVGGPSEGIDIFGHGGWPSFSTYKCPARHHERRLAKLPSIAGRPAVPILIAQVRVT